MSDIEIRRTVIEILGNIAPESNPALIDEKADVRAALDIDSMDFLNFMSTLHARLAVNIPEADYPKLSTIAGAVAYLGTKLRA